MEIPDERKIRWCQSHLNSASQLTTFISFFAVGAVVELKLPGELNENLLLGFVIVTCLLVAVTVLVRFFCTNMIPVLDTALELKEKESFSRLKSFLWLFPETCFLGFTVVPFLFCLDIEIIVFLKYAPYAPITENVVLFSIVPVQVAILIIGWKSFRRVQKFRNRWMTPSRKSSTQYSKFAEDWRGVSVGSPLLQSVFESNTSYGPFPP